MRQFIVKILSTAASFYVAQYFLSGVHLQSDLATYFLASLVFVIFNFFLSPIIKLLLLPINLLTLGLFRWISNVLVLYLFDIFYDRLDIAAFTFPGFTSPYLTIPSGHLNLFWVLVLTSFIMSLTYSLISALFRADN